MCDRQQLTTWAERGLTRRDFGVGTAAGAAGAAAACAPMNGGAAMGGLPLSEGKVSFATPDGTMDGEFFHPAKGRHPAVLFWPDIAGIRPAKRQMARRLAAQGYAVLLANPYYRDVAGQQFADFAAFAGQSGFQKVTPWREKFTAQTVMRDAQAAVAWLDRQSAVDPKRGVGTQGYCMTGSFTIWGAAGVPSRMRVGASYHGGGLVRAGDTSSPHAMLANSRASHIIAIARNDDAKAPTEKDELRKAAEAAGRPAWIDVYPADHGWCVLDSPSYDEAQAEKAWTALLGLYASAL